MHQNWRNLTFLHWRYTPEAIAPFIPPPLQLDCFAGAAWVGLTPFSMTGLRPLHLPPLPWISRFPETNLRTYVRGPDGHPGVWFFSLDTARAPAALAARVAFGLPYCWSRMRIRNLRRCIRYESRRRWPRAPAHTRIEVQPGDECRARPLDTFLTARFRLYSFIGGALTYTAVEHKPWPLYTARLKRLEQSLTSAAGLPDPVGSPRIIFSPGVSVTVFAPESLTP
jgi:uncharacterized protein YqjF (DUF2071 family)